MSSPCHGSHHSVGPLLGDTMPTIKRSVIVTSIEWFFYCAKHQEFVNGMFSVAVLLREECLDMNALNSAPRYSNLPPKHSRFGPGRPTEVATAPLGAESRIGSRQPGTACRLPSCSPPCEIGAPLRGASPLQAPCPPPRTRLRRPPWCPQRPGSQSPLRLKHIQECRAILITFRSMPLHHLSREADSRLANHLPNYLTKFLNYASVNPHTRIGMEASCNALQSGI